MGDNFRSYRKARPKQRRLASQFGGLKISYLDLTLTIIIAHLTSTNHVVATFC